MGSFNIFWVIFEGKINSIGDVLSWVPRVEGEAISNDGEMPYMKFFDAITAW